MACHFGKKSYMIYFLKAKKTLCLSRIMLLFFWSNILRVFFNAILREVISLYCLQYVREIIQSEGLLSVNLIGYQPTSYPDELFNIAHYYFYLRLKKINQIVQNCKNNRDFMYTITQATSDKRVLWSLWRFKKLYKINVFVIL